MFKNNLRFFLFISKRDMGYSGGIYVYRFSTHQLYKILFYMSELFWSTEKLFLSVHL